MSARILSAGCGFPRIYPSKNSITVPFAGIKSCQLANLSQISSPALEKPRPVSSPIHLLLDNLRSTFNVGSIFRTANCAAIDHIYCCGTTPTPTHSKFSKSGLSSEETVPWSYHRNALEIIKDLKINEFEICSLEVADQSKSIFISNNSKKSKNGLLLVVGNEISGIDPGILDLSDSIEYIPMMGSKTSLNVSIAAAIGIYVKRFSLIEI